VRKYTNVGIAKMQEQLTQSIVISERLNITTYIEEKIEQKIDLKDSEHAN